jgi:hypothetical protein
MFAAAAVCPHPPLLVPPVAAGAAGELDALREACDAAVRAVLAARPDLVIIVGDAPRTGGYPDDASGSLHPYGVAVTAALNGSGGTAALPLAHTVGAWLLRHRGGWQGRTAAFGVAADTPPAECLRTGAELAATADRVGLLVMGDGSACRTEKAPGYLDPEAEPFDRAVAEALARADGGALRSLDPDRARRLLAAGRAGWQVLAGAAGDRVRDAALLYSDAPYGVGYHVAVWR